jgi:hypothetical protein
MMYYIECTYPRQPTSVIAVFESKVYAEAYASRHNGEGNGTLNVVERPHEAHLKYEIRVFYGKPTLQTISVPFGASFSHESEALAFAQRHALYKGGYSVVTLQPLDSAAA